MSAHSEFLGSLSGINNVYDGTVPKVADKPPKPVFALPYVLVTSFVPRAGDRSVNRTVHSSVERWRTTVTGANSTSVRIIAGKVAAALEGARIAGCRLERVPDDFPIWEDTDYTDPLTGNYLHYTVIEWRVTV